MRRALLTACFVLLPLNAVAGPGDAATGEALVRTACTMCHKLPDRTGQTVGPGFAELAAKQEAFTAERILDVLNQPQHAPAKVQVTLPDDAADLAAYLTQIE